MMDGQFLPAVLVEGLGFRVRVRVVWLVQGRSQHEAQRRGNCLVLIVALFLKNIYFLNIHY